MRMVRRQGREPCQERAVRPGRAGTGRGVRVPETIRARGSDGSNRGSWRRDRRGCRAAGFRGKRLGECACGEFPGTGCPEDGFPAGEHFLKQFRGKGVGSEWCLRVLPGVASRGDHRAEFARFFAAEGVAGRLENASVLRVIHQHGDPCVALNERIRTACQMKATEKHEQELEDFFPQGSADLPGGRLRG